MASWILAVDFGTVNTGAAVRFADNRVPGVGPDNRVPGVGPDGRIEKVKLDPSSDTMPSAVALVDGQWRVGQAALHARRTHPDTFIGSPKTRLGHEPVVLGDDVVDPAAIVSHVLAAVHRRAVRAAGGSEPDRLVLTHPVRWGRTRLSALQEAARLAGFSAGAVRLVPEPIATLHAHVAPRSLAPGSRVAVVDTGGGTCDVAVLQVTDDPTPGKDLLVVAQEGDDRLGGNDLDDLLYQWVLTQLRDSGRTDMVTALHDPAHRGAALTLLDVVRAAKQDLSEHATSPVAVAVAGTETSLTVTREEYESLIAEPMARVGALATRALTASGTTSLAGLYLTGGTAYTPALSRTLHQVTGILAAPMGDPKLTTAVGALKTPVAVMSTDDLRRLAQEISAQRRPSPAQPLPAAASCQAGPDQSTPRQTEPAGFSGPPPAASPSGPPPHPSSAPGPAPLLAPTASGPASHLPGDTARPSAAPRTSSTGKAVAVVLAVVGIVAAIGVGAWRLWPDTTPGADPTSPAPTTTLPSKTCWNTDVTGPCPEFAGRDAALYVFPPTNKADDDKCQPDDGTYPLAGTVDVYQCRFDDLDSPGGASAYIVQWPSTAAADGAYLDHGFTFEKRWTVGTAGEVGNRYVSTEDEVAPDGSPTGKTIEHHVSCYDDLPFCLDLRGYADASDTGGYGDWNLVRTRFNALPPQLVQALDDALAS